VAVVLIKDALDADGQGAQFAEVLDGLVVVAWTVDEVVGIVSSWLRLAYAAVGEEGEDLVILQETGRVRLLDLPSTGFVGAQERSCGGVLTQQFGNALLTERMATVGEDDWLPIFFIELFFTTFTG